MKMSNETNITLLSSPQPISCSTTEKSRDKTLDDIKRLRQVENDLDDSLGILSIKSTDLDLAPSARNQTRNSIAKDLQQQRILATSCLERASKMQALPSRLLRPSDISNTDTRINEASESTISESDLFDRLPSNSSSTPRDTHDFSSRPTQTIDQRVSLGQSMARLSHTLNNSNIDLSKFIDEYKRTMNTELFQSRSFQSGEDAAALLEAGEMSWRREMSIPAEKQNISVKSDLGLRISMGNFFQKRSENLSVILAKSPEKGPPVPLVDITNDSTLSCNNDEPYESLSLSAIANILSDKDKTPGRSVDLLLNLNKQPNAIKSVEPEKRKFSTSSSKIPAEKENYSHDKFLTSSRSSSSLSNLPNGRLPIDSTKTEIVWGCVKVGKSSSQDFVIRNKSSSRIKFQCAVSKPHFKIISKDRAESESLMSLKLILHPHESRTITISFSPTTNGAAFDQIDFKPLEPHLHQTRKQCIKLFGYGGASNVSLHHIPKDTSGKYWLQLGNISDNEGKKTFSVQNSGTLASFVYLVFTQKNSYSLTGVLIEPDRFVLGPQQTKEVRVTYSLKKGDWKDLQNIGGNSTVIEIGHVKMISGSEVNRARIRRLCHKATEKGLTVDPLGDQIKDKFPGEVATPDLKHLTESIGSMKELLRTLTSNEISVTLEQDPDRTLVTSFPDETSQFHTLISNESTYNDDTIYKTACKVEPLHVVLMPPSKSEDRILLTSSSSKILHYEIEANGEGLEISPDKGTIPPGKTVFALLKCRKSATSGTYKIRVCVDEEVFEVLVKIFFVHSN